ncbi:MAG: OmpA family protein [Timaviella obliquedivisa GSE-PSE-MK23-08B]|jgi:outer membrane protein OmpA-like peptidoglycan-associated protein|nr:OmpA family protein [Timaviella obliquedivisa GSE-PSE-MK23-08B]
MVNPVTQPSERVEKHARKSEVKGGFLLVLIFRLLLLGISGSLAALVGIAIAQFYPDTAQEPPIVEKALRQSQNWVNQQKQALFPAPQPLTAPSPASPIAPSPINQLPPPSAPLSKADRDKLQAELAQLQAQLKGLGDRAATIETQLGETQLGSSATTPLGQALIVTLPSDSLFDATQTTLRPESLALLDSLISDLQRYPGATVRVLAHVDEQGAVAADRSRSFEQAKVVKQYLSSKLGENYQWVAIGYGHSRPLAGNSSQGDSTRMSQGDRQRNRRIEIAIDPQ